MDITTFIIAVFGLIEDFLCGRRLRKRGPQPILPERDVPALDEKILEPGPGDFQLFRAKSFFFKPG